MIISNKIKLFSFLLIIVSFYNCASGPDIKNESNNKSLNKEFQTTSSSFLLPAKNLNQVIHHKYYSLSYSEKDEQAQWVAYKLTVDNSNKNIKRKPHFRKDTKVETGSSELKDYYKSGYHRGHLAPAGSMRINEVSMDESFYMSNISPQKQKFNQGIWKKLENKVRIWSSMYDSLYVVTGPVLSRPIDVIGINNVTVPREFYKTLVGFKKNKIKSIAFIIPNDESDESVYSFSVSIDEVEEITGLDFYFNFTDSIENRIEANNDINAWLKMEN